MNDLKSFEEIRTDLQRLGIARFYYNAVSKMIQRMFDGGVIPNKEPLFEVGKPLSAKRIDELYNYSLYKQMQTDKRLIDAYLLGEPIIPKYGEKEVKGKLYRTVKFYPKSKVKTVKIFIDGD